MQIQVYYTFCETPPLINAMLKVNNLTMPCTSGVNTSILLLCGFFFQFFPEIFG